MSAIAHNHPLVCVPADDGALDRALADLNAKLEAWSHAIVHAQSSLTGILRGEKTVHATPRAKPATTRVTPEPKVSPPKPATPVVETPMDAPPPATTPAVSNEDEALLASLDPKIAHKVQVLRRLPGQTKSVRELIEKVTAAPAHDETHATKKSFWRRQFG